MYFVLALRSAFRNELSYGAKTPIDTVCITAVCNDQHTRLRVRPARALSPSLSRCICLSLYYSPAFGPVSSSLALAVFRVQTCAPIVSMDTPVQPVGGSSVSMRPNVTGAISVSPNAREKLATEIPTVSFSVAGFFAP